MFCGTPCIIALHVLYLSLDNVCNSCNQIVTRMSHPRYDLGITVAYYRMVCSPVATSTFNTVHRLIESTEV